MVCGCEGDSSRISGLDTGSAALFQVNETAQRSFCPLSAKAGRTIDRRYTDRQCLALKARYYEEESRP